MTDFQSEELYNDRSHDGTKKKHSCTMIISLYHRSLKFLFYSILTDRSTSKGCGQHIAVYP